MSGAVQDLDRLTELLADEAAAGLGIRELEELNALLPHVHRARDRLMEAAALTQLALLRRDVPAQRRMPADLRARILAQGQAQLARPQRNGPPPGRDARAAPPRPAARRPWHRGPAAGWYVAAALALALIVFRAEDTGGPPEASLWENRAALLEAEDVLQLPWAQPEAPGFEAVHGDVVWSSARQSGYLRLSGMPVNDPAAAQYQLWIVDPSRDRHPVDGGVFDITDTGEAIIRIQARLPIAAPLAFAITREQPGGVVVSARPLLVVAPVGS